MGFIKHTAIIITSSNESSVDAAAGFAKSIGLEVLGPSSETVNGFRTLLICPDGSKQGWSERFDADERRDGLIEYLKKDNLRLSWVEIDYGGDLDRPAITDFSD